MNIKFLFLFVKHLMARIYLFIFINMFQNEEVVVVEEVTFVDSKFHHSNRHHRGSELYIYIYREAATV